MYAERSCATRRMSRPASNDPLVKSTLELLAILPCPGQRFAMIKVQNSQHTFDCASAHADTMTPSVRTATENTCRLVYLFPRNHPAAIVVTLPKLLRMIWTGTEMLKANAQLLSMLTVKNNTALTHHFRNGTGEDLRK